MRVTSFRWWFEHRETGEITIAQSPNWPLWGVGVCSLAAISAESDSALGSAASWVRTLLGIYWAADELVRGVNPWRRVLGSAVLAWQGVRLVR